MKSHSSTMLALVQRSGSTVIEIDLDGF